MWIIEAKNPGAEICLEYLAKTQNRKKQFENICLDMGFGTGKMYQNFPAGRI